MCTSYAEAYASGPTVASPTGVIPSVAVVEPVAARAHATSAEKVMSTLTRVGVEEGDVGAGDGSDDGGFVRVVRVAAAWCEGWRGGGEDRRRQRAEAKEVGYGVPALWAEAEVATGEEGSGGTLDDGRGGGEVVVTGGNGGVGGTATTAAGGGATTTRAACTRRSG